MEKIKLYLCEYFYKDDAYIDYFVGKEVNYNNGDKLTIFTSLSGSLIGGALTTVDGSQYEMKRKETSYEDTHGSSMINLNCSILSFLEYEKLSNELIKNGKINGSKSEEIIDEVLKYTRENYSKVLYEEKGVLLLAID